MIGLLMKDWYMIKKDCRYILGVVPLFAVCGLFTKTLFWVLWPSLMSATISTSLMGLEDQAGWPLYADTFPVSRKTVVGGKYVLCLLVSLAVTLLQAVLYGVSGVAKEMGMDLFVLTSICIAVGLLPNALMLPMVFKLGMVKGRVAYLISIAVVAGIGGGLGALAMNISPANPLKILSHWLPALVILVVLGLYGLSYLLSSKFYENRDL